MRMGVGWGIMVVLWGGLDAIFAGGGGDAGGEVDEKCGEEEHDEPGDGEGDGLRVDA